MIYRIIKDTATPLLRQAASKLQRPRALLQAVGYRVVGVLREHFQARQAEGNRKGWPSRRFWFGVKNSVANATGIAEVEENSVTVTVASRPFAHKVYGGPIAPKRGSFLAIPLRAEAYALGGKGTLRESAPFLQVLRTPRGLWLIKSKLERSGRTIRTLTGGRAALKRQRLEFWFRLVKSVTQAADPRAMPPDSVLEAGVEDGVRLALPLLLRRD